MNEVDSEETATHTPPTDPAGWAGRGLSVGVKASQK